MPENTVVIIDVINNVFLKFIIEPLISQLIIFNYQRMQYYGCNLKYYRATF